MDESYAQFVSIVADGRGLSEEYVRSISDGRIYTAQQAQQIDLVDDVVDTYEDAVEDMVYEYGLEAVSYTHLDVYKRQDQDVLRLQRYHAGSWG